MSRIAVVTAELAMGGGVLSKLEAFLAYAVQRGHDVELVHMVLRRSPRPALERLYGRGLIVADHGVEVPEAMPHALRFELFHRRFPILRTVDAWEAVAAWLPSALPLARRKLPFAAWVSGCARAEVEAMPHTRLRHRLLYSPPAILAVERQEATVARACDAILVDSRHASERIATAARGWGPVRVLPPPVDIARFRPADRPGRPARPYLLAVARLDRIKDLRTLLRAFAELKRCGRHEDLELCIVGDGPERLPLERSARALGIGAHVRFAGELAGPALLETYQRAELLVLSSRYESLGLAVVEAMACGLPVVATACGGVADSVVPGETGLLVPIGDHGALAAAVEELLVQPEERRRLGLAGRRRAERCFSAERVAAVLDTLHAALRPVLHAALRA